jgi:hypothetical protein
MIYCGHASEFVLTHRPYLIYVKTIVNSEIVICPILPLDFIKTLKNIIVDNSIDKYRHSELSVNMFDIFKIRPGITSINNQFLVTRVKF